MSSWLEDVSSSTESCRIGVRWTDSTTGHHEIVVVAHSPHSFDNLLFIICDDFHTLQCLSDSQFSWQKPMEALYHSQLKAELGHVRRIGLNSLLCIYLGYLEGPTSTVWEPQISQPGRQRRELFPDDVPFRPKLHLQ